MWRPSRDSMRGSYEKAATDLQSHESTEASTMVNDSDAEELDISPEELDFHDPLDESKEFIPTSLSSKSRFRRWRKLFPRLKWLQKRWRSSTAPKKIRPEDADDDNEGDLLNNSWSSHAKWAAAGHATVSWLIWPLPSFLHRFCVTLPPKREVRRPTDYLDGLRGFASLFVFFGHYLVEFKADFIHHGFGADGYWDPLQLPFIRTIYAGPAMVAIFFVISGFVLSARCIVALRQGQHDKLYNALTSMTFRRGLRLFVPSLVASLIALACILLGLMSPRWLKNDETWSVTRELRHYGMFLDDYLFKMWEFSAIQNYWYSQQLWTIPLEFRCSMILFVVILCTARCTLLIRSSILIALQAYLWYEGRWDIALFMAGMLLAEMNVIRDERQAKRIAIEAAAANAVDTASAFTTGDEAGLEEQRPPPLAFAAPHPRRQRRRRVLSVAQQCFLWAVFLLGIYLTGYPQDDAGKTPGYGFLARAWYGGGDHYHAWRFWLGVGGTLVVGATSFLPAAQCIFTNAFARYLGHISYALYLVHVICNRTVRRVVWAVCAGGSFHETRRIDAGGLFLRSLLYFPFVIWIADMFWRAVDIPSVRFAKWVEEKCFVKEVKKVNG